MDNLFDSQFISDHSVNINGNLIKTNTDLSKKKNKKVKLGIRSEYIQLAENQKDNVVPATLDKLEDLGNYKLLTARVGNFVIKSKIKREAEVSSSNISLYMPPERCCVYENERLL